MDIFDDSDPFRDINSTSPDITLKALQKLRAVLQTQKDPPDILTRYPEGLKLLVEILAKYSEPRIQYEAAWILGHVTSGTTEQMRCVVLAGAVPSLIGLLKSRDEDVQEQALGALGNIAGDSQQDKGYVLSLGIIEPLLDIVKPENIPELRITLLQYIAWVIAKLCRDWDAPQPVIEVKKLLPSIYTLIQHEDGQVQVEILRALSWLTANDNELILLASNSHIIPNILDLMGSCQSCLRKPASKIIRNIVEAIPSQREHILACCSDRLPAEVMQELKDLIKDLG